MTKAFSLPNRCVQTPFIRIGPIPTHITLRFMTTIDDRTWPIYPHLELDSHSQAPSSKRLGDRTSDRVRVRFDAELGGNKRAMQR